MRRDASSRDVKKLEEESKSADHSLKEARAQLLERQVKFAALMPYNTVLA